MKNLETLLIQIKKEFYQKRLGKDGFFGTQQFLTRMEVLHKYIMNRLVDNTTRKIIIVGGGGSFESVLFRWR